MKFTGLNHLAMVTGDMGKTDKCYCDVPGMILIATTDNQPEPVALGVGNTIVFFEWPGILDEPHNPAGAPTRVRFQFGHVSCNEESEEALLELKSRLEWPEVAVTRVVDHRIIRSIYFTDRNGIAPEASNWLNDATARKVDDTDPQLSADPDLAP